MAHSFYAVKRGFDKEQNCEVHDLIFTNWLDVKPLVNRYDNARYKGFDTKEEAKVWLEVVDKKDAEKRSKKEIEEIKKDIGIESKKNDSYKDQINEIVKELYETGFTKEEILYGFTDTVMKLLNQIK